MNTSGEIFFIVCAVVAVLSAFGTVLARNPLRGAVSLLIHIIALAGLFVTLHAQLLAALQLLVYAGAVVVLFIFVIMLLGPSAHTAGSDRGLPIRALSIAVTVLAFGGVAFSLYDTTREIPAIARCAPEVGSDCQNFGGVGPVAEQLYVGWYVPFELVSILLLVAIVGAIAVARGRSVEEAEEARKRRLMAEAEESHEKDREQRLSAEVAAHGGHG